LIKNNKLFTTLISLYKYFFWFIPFSLFALWAGAGAKIYFN
jgi:hypothetical protein